MDDWLLVVLGLSPSEAERMPLEDYARRFELAQRLHESQSAGHGSRTRA